MVYFTSNLHLGHNTILKYRGDRFSSIEEHDEYILKNIQKLSKRDILYIIGDGIFDCDKYDYYISELNKAKCRIKYVFGNHCSRKLYEKDSRPKNMELQLPLFSYKSMWISHVPIHPQEMRNRNGCIHGHLHKEVVTTTKYIEVKDKNYFNVNIDVNNYEFVRFETIKEYFSENISKKMIKNNYLEKLEKILLEEEYNDLLNLYNDIYIMDKDFQDNKNSYKKRDLVNNITLYVYDNNITLLDLEKILSKYLKIENYNEILM